MPSDSPQNIARILAAQFEAAGLTQSQIAADIHASQSQISRVLSGHIHRHSKLLTRLCVYAESLMRHPVQPDARSNAELIAALNDVWDGTEAHALALAKVIRSLAVLKPQITPHDKERQDGEHR